MSESRGPEFEKIPDMTLPERSDRPPIPASNKPADAPSKPEPTHIAKPAPPWEKPVIAPGGWRVGDRVLAPWEPIFYYVGTIREIQKQRVLIHFDDGDQGWVGAERIRALVVQCGAKVLSRREMGPLFYPGEIVEVRGDEVLIAFDDGAEEWTRIAALRFPRQPGDNDDEDAEGAEPTKVASNRAYIEQLQRGQRVWAPWSSGVLFVGTIDIITDDRAHIHFDDGDQGWVRVDQLLPFEPHPGMRVVANWKNGGQYYAGVITKIAGNRIHIRYDDGDEEWTGPAALAMPGQIGATDAQPTKVATHWQPALGWLIPVGISLTFLFVRFACR